MPDDRPAAAGSPEEHPPAGSSAAPAAGGQAGSMVRTLTWRDDTVVDGEAGTPRERGSR